MKNNWNIKISEIPNRGFGVSVENNGEYAGAIKGWVSTFDKALQEGKNIVLSAIKQKQNKKKYAKSAQDLFTKRYLMNDMFRGIYGVDVQSDEKGEPILVVGMDTTDEHINKLVPDDISVGLYKYNIKKVQQNTQTVAQ